MSQNISWACNPWVRPLQRELDNHCLLHMVNTDPPATRKEQAHDAILQFYRVAHVDKAGTTTSTIYLYYDKL